jgi:hypothetical protein
MIKTAIILALIGFFEHATSENLTQELEAQKNQPKKQLIHTKGVVCKNQIHFRQY